MQWLVWLPLIALLIFWFVSSNRRRTAEQKQREEGLQPGRRVMLTSGIFGTIRAVGERQVVIELAPGMDVTVVKQAVAKVVTDAEEEFEYSDDEASAVDGAEPAAGEPSEPASDVQAEPTGDETPAAPDDAKKK